METQQPVLPGSYAVGVVHHQTYPDLARCLPTIESQTRSARAVVVLDADGEAASRLPLERAHPQLHFEARPNLGYAGGANAVLAWIDERAPEAEFALILNPDVELAPDFAEALLEAVAPYPDTALATGKLLRRDGRSIDSAGLALGRHRRPRDRGSEQLDCGQFDRPEFVFAASGAALLLRREALRSLAIEGELFDEDFFAYYEDTDLAWRAQRLGWRVLYAPSARAVHGRRWQRQLRSQIDPRLRRHSFKNHYLQIIKNERARDFWMHLPLLAGWELVRFSFALARDPALLGAYPEALRLAPRAFRKRRALTRRLREGSPAAR